ASGHASATATTPAAPTAAATAKRRRCATYRVPNVAAGVAAGDTAASTARASAPETGQRSRTGSSAQAATPTATSRTSRLVAVCDSNSPQIVAAVSAPIAAMTQAVVASPGPRRAAAADGESPGRPRDSASSTSPG